MKTKIRIEEPILKSDFKQALKIIEDTIMRYEVNLDYLINSSTGELLMAKDGDIVVGVLKQFRPGKVFNIFPEGHFALEKIKCEKEDIGYISIVAINPNLQGRGIGKQLVEKALMLQKDLGSKCVGVHCWQGSPGNGSQKLFESFGFEPLKIHKSPWKEYSKKKGPKGYWCPACGNPCICDELEMVKYF
jgi:ribosomal protein S18 acetylase RimI-like enzyme